MWDEPNVELRCLNARSMVHKINYESSIKWNTLVWVVCGFWGKPLELE